MSHLILVDYEKNFGLFFYLDKFHFDIQLPVSRQFLVLYGVPKVLITPSKKKNMKIVSLDHDLKSLEKT